MAGRKKPGRLNLIFLPHSSETSQAERGDDWYSRAVKQYCPPWRVEDDASEPPDTPEWRHGNNVPMVPGRDYDLGHKVRVILWLNAVVSELFSL